MVIKNTVFKYKTKKGLLHKVPALIKLLLLLPLSLLCMSLTPFWLSVGILSAVLASFICGLSLRDQLTDFKPALYYALLMYALSVFSNFIDNFRQSVNQFFIVLIPNHEYLRISLRLVLIVQISALLFRTTSSLEIREALRLEIISLFLSFIPEIFNIWTSVNLAWKARAGKQGLNKIRVTVFILISLSMEKASLKARAAASRQGGKR
jgi:energy-coupling factor transporter transmembrane protein EcfT